MANSTPLFDLIKSLTQSEKRYFKLFANRYETTEHSRYYLELFDRINDMEVYQEKTLVAQLQNDRMFKNLSSGKNYLYNLLLKSLRNYHSSQSLLINLQELIGEVLILEQKGLIIQALKRIKKAEKLAIELQENPDLLKLYFIKRRLLMQLPPQKSEETLNALYEDSFGLVKSVDLELAVMKRFDHLVVQLKKGRGAAENTQIRNAAKWIKEKVEVEQLSFRAKLAYHSICVFENRFIREIPYSKGHHLAMLSLFRQYPKLQQVQQKSYISLLFNYLTDCLVHKDHADVPGLLTELEQIKPKSKSELHKTQEAIWYYKLLYHVNICSVDDLLLLIPKVETYLKRGETTIGDEMRLFFQQHIGYAYFLVGGIDQALHKHYYHKALNKFLQIHQESPSKIRKDLNLMSKVFTALIHVELENSDLAEFFIRSALHLLKGKNKGTPTEQLILNTIRKCIAITEEERIHVLSDLYQRINQEGINPKTRLTDRMALWLSKRLNPIALNR